MVGVDRNRVRSSTQRTPRAMREPAVWQRRGVGGVKGAAVRWGPGRAGGTPGARADESYTDESCRRQSGSLTSVGERLHVVQPYQVQCGLEVGGGVRTRHIAPAAAASHHRAPWQQRRRTVTAPSQHRHSTVTAPSLSRHRDAGAVVGERGPVRPVEERTHQLPHQQRERWERAASDRPSQPDRVAPDPRLRGSTRGGTRGDIHGGIHGGMSDMRAAPCKNDGGGVRQQWRYRRMVRSRVCRSGKDNTGQPARSSPPRPGGSKN